MLVITVNFLSNLECRNLPDFAVNMKSIVVQMAFLCTHKNARGGLVKNKKVLSRP